MYTIWNIGRKFYQESSFASWGRSPRDEGRCFFQATISVRCLLAGILVLVVSVCIGQTDTVATMQPVVDSVADSPYKIFANEIRKGYRKSLNDYLLSKDQHHRDSVVEQMVLCTYEAKEYLRQAPDTVAIKKEIEKIRNWLELADIGVFKDTATAQTYRNLTTTSVLMGEMLQRISVYKEDLWNYRRKLASFKLRYDSLNADSALYNFSEDSATLIREIIKLSSVAVEVQPIDSMLKSTLIQLDEVGSPLYLLESVLKLRLDQIEDYQESLSQNLFHKEFSTIWAKVRNRKPIQEILSFSAAKNWLALRFYVWDHR